MSSTYDAAMGPEGQRGKLGFFFLCAFASIKQLIVCLVISINSSIGDNRGSLLVKIFSGILLE